MSKHHSAHVIHLFGALFYSDAAAGMWYCTLFQCDLAVTAVMCHTNLSNWRGASRFLVWRILVGTELGNQDKRAETKLEQRHLQHVLRNLDWPIRNIFLAMNCEPKSCVFLERTQDHGGSFNTTCRPWWPTASCSNCGGPHPFAPKLTHSKLVELLKFSSWITNELDVPHPKRQPPTSMGHVPGDMSPLHFVFKPKATNRVCSTGEEERFYYFPQNNISTLCSCMSLFTSRLHRKKRLTESRADATVSSEKWAPAQGPRTCYLCR